MRGRFAIRPKIFAILALAMKSDQGPFQTRSELRGALANAIIETILIGFLSARLQGATGFLIWPKTEVLIPFISCQVPIRNRTKQMYPRVYIHIP